MKSALLVLLAFSSLAVAENKPKAWLTGHVISFDVQHLVSVDSDRDHRGSSYFLELDSGDYVYYASRTLASKYLIQAKPVITENSDVQWRLDGDNLIVLTEKNKEFKMHLDKKRKK